MRTPLHLVERQFTRFLRSPLSVRRAMGVIVTATLASVLAGGLLIRLLDPEEFPSVGTGLWWALQTVTTVGYGDVAPQDPWGRVIGAVIMLESIAFVAIVTAAITSNFVERARRQSVAGADPGPLAGAGGAVDVGAEIAALRRQLDRIEQRLDQHLHQRLEQRLEQHLEQRPEER